MSNINTDTSGHLAANGGVRGHSAGDFYPYRVVLQGEFGNLLHWVVAPSGEMLASFATTVAACETARLLASIL